MQTFLATCLLATFIATGESLSCESCFDVGHTCKGPLLSCVHQEDVCIILQIKTSGAFEVEAVFKSCFYSRHCNKLLASIDFGLTAQVLIRTTCCIEKECEQLIPPLPPISTTPNGKKCPACYSVNNLDCKGVVAECTGDKINCVEFAATKQTENRTVPFVLKGCTSHDACEDVFLGTYSEFFTIDRCAISSGPPIAFAVSPLLFLQTTSGLLLLKILL